MENKFEEFQIEEYKNISNAHFETNKQIGIFFRYFLIIVSAPALIFIWFGKEHENFLSELLNGNNIYNNLFIGFFIVFIAIIGFFASFYLVGLKLDSILYARTVNGVRKYFYYKALIKYEEYFRVLPKQTNIPNYYDNHTFGVLFYAVAIINSAYFALGTRIIASVGEIFFKDYLHFGLFINNYNIFWTIGIFLTLFILHIFYYEFLSKYRIINYMKSRIIGIDIDGVLNKHRDIFCKIHRENLNQEYGENIPDNKKLKPDEINKIPVSLIKGKNIDKNDEFDVFNNPKYWEEQEIIEENANKIITELKNNFGFKIFIHRYRPWPQYLYGKKITQRNNLWKGKSLAKITKMWLKNNKIPFNKLHIEKYSIDINNRSISIWGALFGISTNYFKNRFYYTFKKPYKYFVEDDIDNAIKLANNCEYIFLYDQPYNQVTNETKLPKNIIRVKSWVEIKNLIKKLG